MIPRARYVGEKVGRGHLERGAVKGQRGERKDKPNIIEGEDSRKRLKARDRGCQGKKC